MATPKSKQNAFKKLSLFQHFREKGKGTVIPDRLMNTLNRKYDSENNLSPTETTPEYDKFGFTETTVNRIFYEHQADKYDRSDGNKNGGQEISAEIRDLLKSNSNRINISAAEWRTRKIPNIVHLRSRSSLTASLNEANYDEDISTKVAKKFDRSYSRNPFGGFHLS